jgi:predicted lipoprotein with Yx(FWY)xxD motif
MRGIMIGLLVATAPMFAVAEAQQQGQGAVTLEVGEQQPVGRYLTDGDGRSVYMFEADSKNQTTCTGPCAQAWPPVTTQARPQAGQGVDPELLGTIQRPDGGHQVTYNGWPLYYFVKDDAPGDIEGQDVEGFGAEWYLLKPQGQIAHGEDHHDGHKSHSGRRG